MTTFQWVFTFMFGGLLFLLLCIHSTLFQMHLLNKSIYDMQDKEAPKDDAETS